MPRISIKTSAEFREAREDLNLSVSELGKILNINPDTIRKKWESDEGFPPHPAACKFLECMYNKDFPVEAEDGSWSWDW